jgi:predicted  nucleic acid-binding Zn-ribbon protein
MNTDELLQQNLEREAAKAAINTLQGDLKRANKAIEESITTFAALRERNEQLERELAETIEQRDGAFSLIDYAGELLGVSKQEHKSAHGFKILQTIKELVAAKGEKL